MTASVSHLLNRRCQIKTVGIQTWTAYGGLTTTESATTSAQCRVVPLSLREREVLARTEVKATHAVYFEPGTAVNRGDRIQTLDSEIPTDEMVIESVDEPSIHGVYVKAYANCEQQRYSVA